MMNISANSKVRVGVIGVNSRGLALASRFARMAEFEVTHLCDCDSIALERCSAKVESHCGRKPKLFRDIREMLQQPDLDAVIIAMPDHWHATAAIMAMRAGKHVYLEKPTSYCPAENAMLLEAEKKYSVVVEVGNQRRSWPNVAEAIEGVRNGEIGEVHFAKSWYANNRKPIGNGKVVPVPPNLDWDLWQGPAPRQEYHDNYVHYNWHWFYPWSTGEAIGNGIHFVDLLLWGMDLEWPSFIDSVGGRYNHRWDDWQTLDTQLITYQFGDKASFSWEGRSCIGTPTHGHGVGVAFFGTEGTTIISGGNEYRIESPKGKIIKKVKSPLKFKEGNLFNPSEELDTYHFRNWYEAMVYGKELRSSLKSACTSTQLVQLGTIAQRLGHSLQINPADGTIIGSPDAAVLWNREYEPGWEEYLK
ncbi:MAG: Gfo/Idh/MocA family oxidoreductase [Bacteroidales bacterium]|nr:Gfo/Idh/MocA family oxidoreductase [Bacteroidales bacterium]